MKNKASQANIFNGKIVNNSLIHRCRDSIIEAARMENVPVLVFISMRPKQWIKNCFIFAALVFSQNLFVPRMISISVMAFIAFCLISISVYLFNDLMDIEKDKKHPNKRYRPLASGRLSPLVAKIVFIIALFASLITSFFINMNFLLIVSAYFTIQLVYSKLLKEVVILDVFSIASGFFLRVAAGAVAIRVPMSAWLLLCTIFISLFLALGKRRHELTTLGEYATEHRKVLNEYNGHLLDQMVSIVTAGTVLTYSLYTLSPETIERFNTKNLWLTIPVVLYGIFRYLYRVYQKEEGGRPEKILLDDKPLLLSIGIYISIVITILYFRF